MEQVTEIRGELKFILSKSQRIIKYLGKHFKCVRLLYWKLSEHSYLWGIIRFIEDSFKPIDGYQGQKVSKEELDNVIGHFFPSEKTPFSDIDKETFKRTTDGSDPWWIESVK